jgi:hypothetical protein
MVPFLLKRGARPDSRDFEERTPLHLGARPGYLAIAETLLDYGADANAVDGHAHYTALHFAVMLDKRYRELAPPARRRRQRSAEGRNTASRGCRRGNS